MSDPADGSKKATLTLFFSLSVAPLLLSSRKLFSQPCTIKGLPACFL